MLGEAPIASHLLHAQVLDDGNRKERAMGIAAGLAWIDHAEAVVVYADHGISPGMRQAIDHAMSRGRLIEYRYIGGGG